MLYLNGANDTRFLGKKKFLTGQTTGKSAAVFVDKTGAEENKGPVIEH